MEIVKIRRMIDFYIFFLEILFFTQEVCTNIFIYLIADNW